MANNSFIFVRHGQSEANVVKLIANDLPRLTAAGIEQARKTANEVRSFGVTLIACSPVIRAQQTAETIASELGIDIAHIKLVDELRERKLGVLEDKPRLYEGGWYITNDSSEGIEPRQELFDRMIRCLEIIKELGQNDKVLVVGHAISGFYLLQVANGKTSVDAFDAPSVLNNADFIEVHY